MKRPCAVGMSGCNSPHHHHGSSANSPEERERCFGFQSGLALTRIVEEVSQEIPDAIFDFDITEGGRYVGLGFFHPGVSHDKVCRQFTKYDFLIPSILFLTHFLPDKPLYSQKSSLASLVLGGNGIWGDLLSLDSTDIDVFHDILITYKKVSAAVTAAYPITRGFIGSGPEIHEKLCHDQSAGIVVFFAKQAGTFTHITEKINPARLEAVIGADSWTLSDDGYLTVEVHLEQNDSRIVFLLGKN